MYRTVQYYINEKDEIYEYCKIICHNFKNMYNVTNYYIRNVMTGIKKDIKDLNTNEKEILDIVNQNILLNNESMAKRGKTANKPKVQLSLPTIENWFLDYQVLNAVFSLSNNVDYRNLPSQMAQKAIKKCVESWKAYFVSNKDSKINPYKYKGKCNIPHYIKTNMTTVALSNQNFSINADDKGRYISFAKLKDNNDNKNKKGRPYKYYIGNYINTEKFEKIEIRPYHFSFVLLITYKDDSILDKIAIDKNAELRVMGIDIGVKNFATITDNLGNCPIIIKGEFLKSRNQYFNKYKSLITSNLQKSSEPIEKHKTDKKLDVLSINRDRFFRDCFYKISHKICRIAEERNVNTIVIGHNKHWKTGVKFKEEKNTQNFVNIPFSQFIFTLIIVGLKYGIKAIENEESYTSQASFLDNDKIPTYKKGKNVNYTFSGKRPKRGKYISKDGIMINADVNASLNMIRKNFKNCEFHSFTSLNCITSIQTLNYYDFYPTKRKPKNYINMKHLSKDVA